MLKRIALLLTTLLYAGFANAIYIEDGDVFEVHWDVDLVEVDHDEEEDDDFDIDDGVSTLMITATSLWTVSHYSSDTIVIDISLTNTTVLDPGILDQVAITAFGFGVEPDPDNIELSSPGSTFDSISSGKGKHQSFPGGYKEIDVCLFSGNKCSGGKSKSGLQAGESDSLQITLTGSFESYTELILFPAKFQTSLGSYEPHGDAEIIELHSSSSVDAPYLPALMASGLVLLVLRRRLFADPAVYRA